MNSLYVKDTGGDFENPETGLQQGVCSHITDLGMIDGQFGPKHKVMLCFELKQHMRDGRPFMVSQEFTASLNEKANLCKTLESWRGKKFTDEERKGFDLAKLMGANAFLNITINDKGYTKILGVSPMPKGIEKIIPTGQKLPEWIAKKAMAGLAFAEQLGEGVPPPDDSQVAPDDSTLPF